VVSKSHRPDHLRFYLVSLLALLTAVGVSIVSAPMGQAATPPTAARHVAGHDVASVGRARGVHKLPAPQVAGRNAGTNASFTATNWDGYTVTNTASTNTTTFNSVSATWVVPKVTCNAAASFGSTWVGLDGWLPGSAGVEQGGSSAQCVNSVTPRYVLWWEMFPFNAEQDTVQINAGDTVHGSVTFDAVNDVFDIVITDETLNKGLSESVACQPDMGGCPRSSAEVISEDTGGSAQGIDGLFALPNYGTTTFTNVSVTDVNGHTGTLSNPNWVTNNVTEVSSIGVTKQTVGVLSPDGSSFSTTWKEYMGDGVTVQANYKALTLAPTTPELDIELNIVNTGDHRVFLGDIIPEYWFSDEDPNSPLEFACDFATVGCANVSATVENGFNNQPPTANSVAALSFELGSAIGQPLEPGQSTDIQFRIFHADFSQMTQANDYSFNAADTTLTPNPLIPLFVVDEGGANWGVPPPD
jgi:hypothetical protein